MIAPLDETAARPLLRGVLHGGAFVASCVIGVLFVIAAPDARVLPALAFAVSATVMLGTSTLYHRIRWKRTAARLWMRRADHAGIFLLIAGTYTPVGLISLHGPWRITILAIVWSGAALAILVKMCWVRAPKVLSAAVGVALGWAGVAALPQIMHHDGIAPVVLLGAGGLAYTAGAVVYALRRPDPFPNVFGYHELFHALTIGALACQYVAVAFFVVRVG
ncbi:MAG TPA: hemolysin III family protein [Gaiellaceae bacterium]|nr:hemolysin III family protein [Gaiellaceae bacterium]